MRVILTLTLILLITGCSSKHIEPVSPSDELYQKVSLLTPYSENGNYFIDITVDNIPSLYQFSLRVEYDSVNVEFLGFEPSSDFGTDPLVLAERISDIPQDLRTDMQNPNQSLIAIAVSRPYPHLGDIESPNKLGRIRYSYKSDFSDTMFSIFEHPDYLVFRDHKRNRIDIKPVEPSDLTGGGR